ncbi:MAG: membrane protein insertase YidC [Christensenellaceae bacterium]|nr:membrane protein insertase YidC [Christensenellaceae bacterium]
MNQFFSSILLGINAVIGNYGWSVVVFTLLIRLLLTPLDVKSRVSMRKMNKLQPQVMALQKKYAKDQQKLNLKTQELYRKEKVNPLSSCLPLLLSFPILIVMFNAMRGVANEQMVKQAFDIVQGNTPVMESWLWIKNIWMPDSPFNATWPDLTRLQQIPANIWQNVFNSLPETTAALLTEQLSLTAESFTSANLRDTVQSIYAAMAALPGYADQIATIPGFTFNLLVTSVTVYRNFNGLFILPIFSAVSQYLMTILQPTQPQQTTNDKNGQQQPSSGAFMKWFFPLFSLWICSGYYASFAIYWMTSNLLAIAQNLVINWYLDRKDAQMAVSEGEVK